MSEARLSRHRAVAQALSAVGDRELAGLLEAASFTTSIGGGSTVISVAGTPVFVKRVALTDLEATHARSTRNLFELPMVYHYGVGSSGFGAWRELAAHELTTGWVLDGTCAAFPLLHHARVLPAAPAPIPVELLVARWGGSSAIRARLEGIARTTASVVLFLEYFPATVGGWFLEQVARGDASGACDRIERETLAVAEVMRAHELLHMDAHWGNLLTDGQHVYFGDLGLAIARSFELSWEERAFAERHARYDEHVLRRELVVAVTAAGVRAPALQARHGAIASTLGSFLEQLRLDNTTRYPDSL